MIYLFNQHSKLINTFDTQEEASIALNTTQPTISKGIKGKQKYVKNFIILQSEKEPYEAFFDHCFFYSIPFYNSGFIVQSTITGNIIWKALSINPIANKLKIKNLQCIDRINSAMDGKIITFSKIVYFDNFDIILT